VKEYEIDTFAYYQRYRQEIPLDIDLDGIIASRESSHHFENPPIIKKSYEFTFPHITERGVYVTITIPNLFPSNLFLFERNTHTHKRLLILSEMAKAVGL